MDAIGSWLDFSPDTFKGFYLRDILFAYISTRRFSFFFMAFLVFCDSCYLSVALIFGLDRSSIFPMPTVNFVEQNLFCGLQIGG